MCRKNRKNMQIRISFLEGCANQHSLVHWCFLRTYKRTSIHIHTISCFRKNIQRYAEHIYLHTQIVHECMLHITCINTHSIVQNKNVENIKGMKNIDSERRTAHTAHRLQHIATHLNTLQHLATHCTANTMQHTAILQHIAQTLQLTATHYKHCNTLQHHLQHTASRKHTANKRYAEQTFSATDAWTKQKIQLKWKKMEVLCRCQLTTCWAPILWPVSSC